MQHDNAPSDTPLTDDDDLRRSLRIRTVRRPARIVAGGHGAFGRPSTGADCRVAGAGAQRSASADAGHRRRGRRHRGTEPRPPRSQHRPTEATAPRSIARTPPRSIAPLRSRDRRGRQHRHRRDGRGRRRQRRRRHCPTPTPRPGRHRGGRQRRNGGGGASRSRPRCRRGLGGPDGSPDHGRCRPSPAAPAPRRHPGADRTGRWRPARWSRCSPTASPPARS